MKGFTKVSLGIGLALLLVGCQPPEQTPTPTATPQKSLQRQAEEKLQAEDFEGAALLYRDLLDQLEKSGAPAEQQQAARAECQKALVEAGGFVSSKRVWEKMAQEKPEGAKAAERMKARAERMMLQQGGELLAIAREDLEAGHKSKAEATARAALTLFTEAKAEAALLKETETFLQGLNGA